jgi:DNA-binding NtrC family response regulator
MGTKILIVEDQFIEANDLKITLETAGHNVSGIAKSYDHALVLIERERPEIVLLDIFLKGKLTGLDLADVLSKENIPFIYLSANSSASILETVKATRPYGFLVKPFREKDVLVALDIASYRHNHTVELIYKQERLLSNILCNILTEQITAKEKMLLIIKAFKPYIPFDYAIIDVDVNSDDLNAVYCFHRTGYDEYKFLSGKQLVADHGLDVHDYNDWRKNHSANSVIKIENGSEFEDTCNKITFLKSLSDSFNVQSRMVAPLSSETNNCMCIRMFSEGRESFNADHLELIIPLRSLLSVVIGNTQKQKPNVGADNRADSVVLNLANNSPLIEGIVGTSAKLLHALDQAAQVSNFDMSVLILGETGVGKEGLVQAIHRLSNRSKKPLIKINCAAMPASLIESELFGHERGAFTGAFERRIGKFEQAQGGTLFLDEIGEIPLEIQTKLLRVLQEKELERIGGRTTIKVDVRVIAATNRNLHKDVAAGRFRMDLYYRINVFPIMLAPLRERREDIPLLTDFFLKQHAERTGSPVKQVTPAVMQKLIAHSWPGNIRELLHVIERNIVLNNSRLITVIALPDDENIEEPEEIPTESFRSIAEVDKDHIIAALKKCNGRVAGKGGAAEILNLPATTLNSKMKKLGISWKFMY